MNHIEDGIVAAADAQSLGGKAPAYYLQPRNLLDNSDFAHPVNSQGKSSYTANGYTIDRWMIYSGSGNQAMSLQDGILYFKGYLYQYVPVSDDVICTFAAKFSDGYILCVSGTASQVQSADLGNAHITFYHQSEMPYPQVTISTVDETQPIGLIWAALYEGSYTADTLPPYVPKGYAAELAECMRYYELVGVHKYSMGRIGEVYFDIQFTQKRISPTVTMALETASNNITNRGEVWNANRTSAGGLLYYVNDANMSYWYGSATVSADL